MEQAPTYPQEFLPRHVVIIPDGNRRYAKARGEEPWRGHEAGAKNTEALIREARRIGIREISFWGSSLENLAKRPRVESLALLRIYETYFRELLHNEDIFTDRARIRMIGRWREQFPENLKKLLVECEEKTKTHDRYFLNFFLAYSGDDDIRQAFATVAAGHPAGEPVTDAEIKGALMTRDLPPVDLLIRTGGEPHLSAGFLMWDIQNSQLYFSEKLYPDFGPEAFRRAIEDYLARERRFGK
jgi:undecaprenyl diphosphate synthase